MGEKRTALMDATATGDFGRVRELGWMDTFLALQGWWAKQFGLFDLGGYADVLGDEDPMDVYEALRSLRGEEWRPAPSALYRAVESKQARASQARANEQRARGEKPRPDQDPAALARVRMLIEAGEKACECMGSRHYLIEELDGGTWSSEEYRRWQAENKRRRAIDKPAIALPPHIMRCRDCHGIEQGQVYAAEDETPDFTLPAA